MIMEETCSSETSVHFYQTARGHIRHHSNLHSHRPGNRKSHKTRGITNVSARRLCTLSYHIYIFETAGYVGADWTHLAQDTYSY
jgi:hypothetical protein